MGGMAKALRTIPVILKLAKDMAELALGVPLVNFTNLAGLVTEALTRHAAEVQAIGVCNVPITAKMMILALLERRVGEPIEAERTQLKTLGINHLSWHRVHCRRRGRLPIVIEGTLAELRASEHPEWDPELIETLQMLPNYYL